MALAGDHHDVVGGGPADGQLDRGPPVRLDDELAVGPGPVRQPSTIASMIRTGSSDRGLSDVMTVTSASRPATPPISGRFPASRSPPHPNTTMTLAPGASSLAVAIAVSSAAGVWA